MSAVTHPLGLAYVGAFGLAAAVCLGSLWYVDRVKVADTRRGLASLFAAVGVWAVAEGTRVLVTDPTLSVALYLVGLVAGLASVGAWLYFCSAYTGRDYHRSPTLRAVVVGFFATVTLVKVTNPLHGAYFSARVIATPFPHVMVIPNALHWVVMGVAYALSAVGFFMLFDLFTAVEEHTRRLAGLVALSGLPVVGNVAGIAVQGDMVLGLNYEPLGVAALAIGVLFVADDAFLAVQQQGREQVVDVIDEAVVILDADERLREVNDRAGDLVPALEAAGAGADPPTLERVAPELDIARDTDGAVECKTDGEQRWLTVTERRITQGEETLGYALVLTDVSDVVEQRNELERQNEQLEEFAAAITHELRNTLNIVTTRLAVLRQETDAGRDSAVTESLTAADRAADRAARVIDDLATLARKGQSVETTEGIAFRPAVEEAWNHTDTDGMALTVDGEGTIEANRARFVDLMTNAAEFAAANGAGRLTVTLAEDGFTVTDDGETPSEDRVDDLFTYGEAVPDAASGMFLPVVKTLARVHGWTVIPDPDYDGGVRYHVGGVAVERPVRVSD